MDVVATQKTLRAGFLVLSEYSVERCANNLLGKILEHTNGYSSTLTWELKVLCQGGKATTLWMTTQGYVHASAL